jgi:hypothetical protein
MQTSVNDENLACIVRNIEKEELHSDKRRVEQRGPKQGIPVCTARKETKQTVARAMRWDLKLASMDRVG